MGSVIKCVYEDGCFKPIDQINVSNERIINIELIEKLQPSSVKESTVDKLSEKIRKKPTANHEQVEKLLELAKFGDLM